MSDLFSSRAAEAAIAWIEQQVAEAQLRAEQAQQVQADIDAVRATATAPRREVAVTVDATGRLTDIRLADAAYDVRPDASERLIVETAGAAQRLAGEQALEISQPRSVRIRRSWIGWRARSSGSRRRLRRWGSGSDAVAERVAVDVGLIGSHASRLGPWHPISPSPVTRVRRAG